MSLVFDVCQTRRKPDAKMLAPFKPAVQDAIGKLKAMGAKRVGWLLSRSQMTAVDDAGRTFPQLYDVAGDRDLENIVSVVFEGRPSLLAARRLAFHVEDRPEPLVSIDLPRFAETETEGKALEFG